MNHPGSLEGHAASGTLLGMALNSIYTAITKINAVGWFSTFGVSLRKSVMDLVAAAEYENVNFSTLT